MTRQTHDIINDHFGVLDDAQLASGTPSSGDAPLSNGDGTRTWGPASGGGDITVTDGTVTVSPATTLTFPSGSVTDGGSGDAVLTSLSGPFEDDGGGTWKFSSGQNEISDEDVNAYLFMPGGSSGRFDLNATTEALIEANDGSPGVHGVAASTAKHNLLGGFGVVVPRLTADPNSGDSQEGQIYMNTTTHKFRGYNGSAWQDLN